MQKVKRAQPLNAGQYSRLIKITRATSRYAERDVLVLALGHHCGLRVTEISRITVADVMQASGKLRTEVSLREPVTKGCRQRCAYLVTKPLIEALEGYLSFRIERDIGMDLGTSKYRGLLPNQPLVYSGRGAALSQNTKRRVLESGEQKNYKACDSLQSHITLLYKRAGLKESSSHSGRRTFAGKVLASTGDMGTVAQLLGHSSIDCTQRYVDINQVLLQEMFTNAV
jgi:site-specific recombinase XerD